MRDSRSPARYLGVAGVAEQLGVNRHAVHTWRTRYPTDSAHPFPVPDVEIDGAPGWRASRVTEVMRWREVLRGLGADGGRPSAASRDYFAAATARGLDRDEAQRAIDLLTEEFPELTEAQLFGWLVDSWS